MVLRWKRMGAEFGRSAGVMPLGDPGLLGSAANPLEFGRFLLASAGFHLMLAFAVMTVGLHRSPFPEKPLVVRLVEEEAPKPSPTTTQPVRARARQQATPPAATEPAGPKEIAQANPALPSVGRPEPGPSRAVEMIDRPALDEQRAIASQRAVEELVKELRLPARIRSADAQNAAGSGIAGPKSVAAPSRVAMVPGTVAGGGLDSELAMAGVGSAGGGPGRSRGNAEKGLPKNLIPLPPRLSSGGVGRAGGGGGPRAIGGGATVAIPSAGLSSGPALLGGGGGGETASGQAGRGERRRLGAGLTAPLAPTVTVGSRQGAGGGGPGGGGGGSGGGKFARPDYGTNPLPKYPPLAREKGYEGTVYLRVMVQTDGRVGKLSIDRSSGHEILDRAAADSVKGWTFLPAQKGGKPVESWVLLPVKFKLD